MKVALALLCVVMQAGPRCAWSEDAQAPQFPSLTTEDQTPAPESGKPKWTPPRRRPRYKNFKKKSKAPAGPKIRLKPGRWLPEVRLFLERMISDKVAHPETQDLAAGPAAVFVLDDGVLIHHAGENVFYRLVSRVEFKFNDDFWRLVPPPYNRKVKMGYDEFKGEPPVVWPRDPYYLLYRKALFSAYESLCREQNLKTCHGWLAGLFKGFGETEAEQYSVRAVREAEKRPVGEEAIFGDIHDPSPVRARVGLEAVPEFKNLISVLRKHGFEVWLLSSSNQWAAQSAAASYGIEPDHVRGIRPKIKKGVLQAEVEEPIPDGTGRAELVSSLIGRDPALIIGSGAEDKAMLEYGKGLRLVLDRGDEDFVRYAHERGWLVQTAFPPLKAARRAPH